MFIKKKINIINFSNNVNIGLNEIRNFLKIKMYNHHSIKKWNINSEKIIYCLYEYFKKNIKKIPNFNKKYNENRNIADYISGMTDKFALNVYNSIK